MRAAAFLTGLAVLLSLAVPVLCLAGADDLEITGDVRLRLRYVDSGSTDSLAGTYGEFVRRGFSQKHRFILEASYPLADVVRVGGLVRVSNEDPEVLRSGPEYLSSEFGSAFIAYETPTVMARFGYYSLVYTPLTMMRWDVTDDPEGGGGGCAVCGGPGVAGAILGETLEELGPDLRFEGLKIKFTPNEMFGFEAHFARPSISGEAYPVVTYGGRATFKRYFQRAGSFLDLGVLALRSEDDRKSLEGDDEDPMGKVFRNSVFGFSWKVPITRRFAFAGEWNLTDSEGDDLGSIFSLPWDIQGRGGVFSVSAEPHKKLSIDASYIYLSPNWDSFFRALSYSANREGVRLRVEYAEANMLVALFGRYLRPVDPVYIGSGTSREVVGYPTYSARGYWRVTPDLNVGIAAIYSAERIDEDAALPDLDTERTTVLGTVTYEFNKDSSVSLEERYVQNRTGEGDSDVSLTSLYVTASLW
jgi:hypothetical protein